MSKIKTFIAIRHSLVIRGLMHYLYHVLPEPEIEIVDIMYLMNHKNPEEKLVLILEPELISDPKQVTIEKIYRNYRQSKLISLSGDALSISIGSYFDENLLYTDPEEILVEKLRCIYNSCGEDSQQESGSSILSEREKEVLRQVALGHTNKEISNTLSISTHTVITHRKNITAKLGIKTIAGLTVYAVLNGIISSDETIF
jgi:DNA-binding CsgD family transcriptional regulator